MKQLGTQGISEMLQVMVYGLIIGSVNAGEKINGHNPDDVFQSEPSGKSLQLKRQSNDTTRVSFFKLNPIGKKPAKKNLLNNKPVKLELISKLKIQEESLKKADDVMREDPEKLVSGNEPQVAKKLNKVNRRLKREITEKSLTEAIQDAFDKKPIKIGLTSSKEIRVGQQSYSMELAISRTIDNDTLDLKQSSKNDLIKQFDEVAKKQGCTASCKFKVRKLSKTFVPALSMRLKSMVKQRVKRESEADAGKRLSDAIKQHLKNNPFKADLTDGSKVDVTGLPADDEPPPPENFPAWAIALIVISIILLLILIILVVIFMRRKKKKEEEKNAQKPKPKPTKPDKDGGSANEGFEATSAPEDEDDWKHPSTKPTGTEFVPVETAARSTTMSTPEQTVVVTTTTVNPEPTASAKPTASIKPEGSATNTNLSNATAVTSTHPADTTTVGTVGGVNKQSTVITTLTTNQQTTKQSSGSGAGTSSAYTSSEASEKTTMNTKGKVSDESKASSSVDM